MKLLSSLMRAVCTIHPGRHSKSLIPASNPSYGPNVCCRCRTPPIHSLAEIKFTLSMHHTQRDFLLGSLARKVDMCTIIDRPVVVFHIEATADQPVTKKLDSGDRV